MNKRITGILGAVVLALVGTFALTGYVQSARDHAVSKEALVDVWVVQKTIPSGTAASAIKSSLKQTKVPARIKADKAVTDLTKLDGLVATEDLLPGDQLVEARFGTPSVARQGDIAANLLRVTVKLDPERALGGQIRPGDKVGVIMSFQPTNLADSVTTLSLHQVTVASVQIAPKADGVPSVAGEKNASKASTVESAPTDSLLVTLALDPAQVDPVVFAAEFGTIWLAAESSTAPATPTQPATLGSFTSVR